MSKVKDSIWTFPLKKSFAFCSNLVLLAILTTYPESENAMQVLVSLEPGSCRVQQSLEVQPEKPAREEKKALVLVSFHLSRASVVQASKDGPAVRSSLDLILDHHPALLQQQCCLLV